MSLTGIDTVAVVVSDRQQALRWYRDLLGLNVALMGPEDPTRPGDATNLGHWIELGELRPMTRIHLCELPDQHVEPGPTGVTFLSDSIEEDYERLRARGVEFLAPPRLMDWGEWLCAFRDPDGNEFDLKQPASNKPVEP
jgi:lactoylglutathione lyase